MNEYLYEITAFFQCYLLPWSTVTASWVFSFEVVLKLSLRWRIRNQDRDRGSLVLWKNFNDADEDVKYDDARNEPNFQIISQLMSSRLLLVLLLWGHFWPKLIFTPSQGFARQVGVKFWPEAAPSSCPIARRSKSFSSRKPLRSFILRGLEMTVDFESAH